MKLEGYQKSKTYYVSGAAPGTLQVLPKNQKKERNLGVTDLGWGMIQRAGGGKPPREAREGGWLAGPLLGIWCTLLRRDIGLWSTCGRFPILDGDMTERRYQERNFCYKVRERDSRQSSRNPETHLRKSGNKIRQQVSSRFTPHHWTTHPPAFMHLDRFLFIFFQFLRFRSIKREAEDHRQPSFVHHLPVTVLSCLAGWMLLWVLGIPTGKGYVLRSACSVLKHQHYTSP